MKVVEVQLQDLVRKKGYGGDPVFARSRFKSVAQTLKEVPVVSAALGPVAGLPASRFCRFSLQNNG